jgi:replicative DNA helicase
LAQAEAALSSGHRFGLTPWPTGFSPLDAHLSGGLRAGELVLIGGKQGLGKTTLALQMARNMVASGQEALYVCYEHAETQLVERLLVLEAGLAEGDLGVTKDELRLLLDGRNERNLTDLADEVPSVARALQALHEYGGRLHLLVARSDDTTLADIRAAARNLAPAAIFVDYIQKVATGDGTAEADRVPQVASGLKDLALDLEVPVVAIAALERGGMETLRARARHIRTSEALAYEADIILMLNDKFDIIARHHLVYDSVHAASAHDWVVCSIEKNRDGEDGLDIEFRKRLAHSRFDPHGAMVNEQLIDERVFRE